MVFEGNYILILVFGVLAWLFYESGMDDMASYSFSFGLGVLIATIIIAATKGVWYLIKNK